MYIYIYMWLYIHIGYSQLLKHRCLKLGEKSSCREAPRGIGRLGNPRGTHGSQRGAIYVRSRWCEAEKGSVGVFFGFVTKLGYPKFYWCIIMFPIMILEVYPIPFGVQFLRYNLFLSDTAHMFFHLVWVCKDIKKWHPIPSAIPRRGPAILINIEPLELYLRVLFNEYANRNRSMVM